MTMSSAGNLVIIDDSREEPLDGNTQIAFQSQAEEIVSAGRGRTRRKSRSKGRGRGGNGSRPASVGSTLRGNDIGSAQRQPSGISTTLNALCTDFQQVNIVSDGRNNSIQARERARGYQGSGVAQTVNTLEGMSIRQGNIFACERPLLGNFMHGIAGRINNDSDVIFNFMVKNMAGKGTPQEIVRQSGMFPLNVDIDQWFRQRKDKFVLIEKNNIIHTVLVYNKAVAFCLNYTKPDSCNLASCPHYHVCRHLLAGKCEYGQMKCKFSHNFFDPHNMRVSGKLGFLYNKFTSEEICTILKTSQPHVCLDWALEKTCANESCIDLHICPLYILGKCKNGRECSLSHDKLSEHNTPIVNAFGMSEMHYRVFRFRVFLKKLPAWCRNESSTSVKPDDVAKTSEASAVVGKVVNRNVESTEAAHSRATVYKQANKITLDKQSSASQGQIQLDTDEAGSKNICDLHIFGKCRRKRGKSCDNLHGDIALPYLWQIQWFGCWKTLETLESEVLEKAFCDNLSQSVIFSKIFDDMQTNINIVFQPNIQARISIVGVDDGFSKTKARRLSTVSYKEQSGGDQDGFKTQWRWYWEDDYRKWQLFQPDTLQHTLEVKYLAKQTTYIYWRENYQFKYVINFHNMYQQNLGTRKKRNIARRPVFVSSDDVKGKTQPLRLTQVPVVDVILPADWLPWDLTHPFEMVDITGNKSETEKVTCNFFNTLDKTKYVIRSIVRIQNPKLWGLFCSQEKTMEASARRVDQNQNNCKRYLFHGTDSMDAVIGICINNFDTRVSGKNATRFGDGAYFARDAKYSHAYTQEPTRYIFMAYVLVGQYTKGDASYRRPPPKPGSDHELYDSCVDDLTNPSVFVVFDRNQYYPEYLIQYQDTPEQLEADLGNNQSQQQIPPKPPVPAIHQVPYVQPPTGNVLVEPKQRAINRRSVDSTQTFLMVQNDSTSRSSTQRISQPLSSRTLDPTKDGYTYTVSSDVNTSHVVSSMSFDSRRISAVDDFAAFKTKTNIDAETRIRRHENSSKSDAIPFSESIVDQTLLSYKHYLEKLKLMKLKQKMSETRNGDPVPHHHGNPVSHGNTVSQRNGDTVSQRHGDTVSQRNGETVSQRNGDTVFQRDGGTVFQRHGDTVSQRLSDTVSQRNGDTVFQRQGDTVFQRQGDTVSQRQGDMLSQRHGDTVFQRQGDTVFQRQGDTVFQRQGDMLSQRNSDTVSQRNGDRVSQRNEDTVFQRRDDTVSQCRDNTVSQRRDDTVSQRRDDTVYQCHGDPFFNNPGDQGSHSLSMAKSDQEKHPLRQLLPSTEEDERFELFRRKREIARLKRLERKQSINAGDS